MGKDSFYAKFGKEAIDRTLALIGLICFWWVLALIAIAVKIDDPSGPVVFKQVRLGKYGKPYFMYKFRTMRVGAEQESQGVYSDDHDPRVTRVGRILRKTSGDELAQLFNVLKGEVAFIGFRSPLTYHPWTWEEYTEEQKKMFALKPGITGWAQVNGRKTVEWNRRIEMNVWYAENVSLLLDLKILFLTVFKVFTNADNENVGETVKK